MSTPIVLCMYPKFWLTVPNSKGYPARYLDACCRHRVHTEWQLPISGVHLIVKEKFALAGDGGVARPTPIFTLLPSRTNYKVAVYRYAPAERAGTLPVFNLYPYMYSVVAGCSVRSSWEGVNSPYFISIPICALWLQLQVAVCAPAERA